MESINTYKPCTYTARAFCNLCAWRDEKAQKTGRMFFRVVVEPAFVLLAIASAIELIIVSILFTLHVKEVVSASYTIRLCISATIYNLLEKNLSSKIKKINLFGK